MLNSDLIDCDSLWAIKGLERHIFSQTLCPVYLHTDNFYEIPSHLFVKRKLIFCFLIDWICFIFDSVLLNDFIVLLFDMNKFCLNVFNKMCHIMKCFLVLVWLTTYNQFQPFFWLLYNILFLCFVVVVMYNV